MAVTIAYGAFLGGFTWELAAFKAKFDDFGEGAVADLAKLVFPSNAAGCAVGAGAFLHFGAFLTSDPTNTNLQS